MRNKLFTFITVMFFCIFGKLFSQTYQLTGNPVNTTGWDIIPSAIVNGDFIRLTTDQITQVGGIKLNTPINLKYCNKWKVEFDFRIDGTGTYAYGDGIAFWYLANPPAAYALGGGLGIPDNASGLMVAFDTYNNINDGNMSKVHVLYGSNNVNLEFNNTPGSTFHSADLTPFLPFLGANYKHVEVTGQIDPANLNNWIITIKINNTVIVSQSFAPSGGALNMTQGYFGFSASTGAASARHSIKNVKIYTDKVPILQNTVTQNFCPGGGIVNLNTFNSQFVANPNNYIFTYYVQGNPTPIANPTNFQFTANTVVSVVIKDASLLLCDNVDGRILLNFNPVPIPVITSSSPTLCFGGNVTLTSDQTTGNLWSTGATTQSITVTNPGTYTLSNAAGICIPGSITIHAESDPNVQITGNSILCESPIQLTASANGTGNTYLWSNGSAGNTVSVSTPGTYTVTVKTPANCQYQKSVTVTQGIVPVVQNSSLITCSDLPTATFDLTSAQSAISTTPGVSFDYYLNQADALAGNAATIANPAAFASGNATIYVRVKSNACWKISELQLTVNLKPVPVITPSANAICHNNSITLTSNFTTGNIWSTGETTQTITTNIAGVYTLTNHNGTCTSNPVSITIVEGIDPNVQITGNLSFCQGTATTLTATAAGTGNTFAWSNGINGAINTITAPGTYTVTVTTAVGCQYQKSVTVTMDPAITVHIATPATITCNTPEVTLDATLSVYQPGATFSWTAAGGGTILSGANTLTPTVISGGMYTLTITSANPLGCVRQGTITVISDKTPPVINISAPVLTICKGYPVTLTASGAVSYIWTGLPGNGNTQTVSPAITTTYTVTGVGANGCTSLVPGTITIKVIPEIVSSLQDIEICKGHTGILDAGAGLNYTYLWNTGATTQTINVTNEGTYSVTISNGVCLKTYSAKVFYTIIPEITDVLYSHPALTIKAKNNENMPLEYSIDGGITWQASNIFTNVFKNTQYHIRVRNRGILCDASIEYYTFFMSNVITPNHDGINDFIDFSIVTRYKNFEGDVFDKYGKQVFKPTPTNPKWNGQYVSRVLPTDTYWYKLSWEDPVNKKSIRLSGWILLKNRD